MGLLDQLRDAVGGRRSSRRFECADCGRTLAYAPSVEDPSCPYCDSAKLRTRESA
ncbi:hydrogenase maturation nickel metallochaperone HypA [Natronoarchaeum rubrum]|uniref:hydrogenase maturation nickel metallochaperone HypA n=1 Tax=Natronoarchaeum rubrum TaxID=755311 RepID=UPI002112E7CC|nr:hydrogenase maturation nickel metallochaperone HypA [Natronoarchaeum rubrum]